MLNIVASIPVAKLWLCKQWPLLGNARNIDSRNNRTTGLYRPVSKQRIHKHASATTELLLETVFFVGSAPRLYDEDSRPNCEGSF
jgi:hypothetical protein